ncbi:MAG: DegT/DnrJ/EryC1/StrS family aminotransferase, partial [Candidatus Beckwithbacteria bacterium]|nr:DegT/DnrJ/EryC1/StrS family aminotransferase [Candidatus Beckwithbacteria bacterium]
QTQAFEAKMAQLTHTKYAVALNSATAALHLSFLTSIRPGDEVISPSLTFVAANQAILQAGGKIVFSDCDPETLSSDPRDILKKITPKTKAILVLHYGGHPTDMKPLLAVCRQKKIILIEDCAHAAGSYYYGQHVGGFGDLGCFSFAAIKNITTADGGMVVTNDRPKADRIRHLAWSGISSTTWKRYSGQKTRKWEYDVTALGFKYQMNDLAASLGLVQFRELKQRNRARKLIFKHYNQAFRKLNWVKIPVVKPWAESSHHNYFIKVDRKIRNKLIDYLNQKGISANVHYLPNHYYKMFNNFPHEVPVTESVWQEIVLLPIFPDLSTTDQGKIIQAVYDFN